MERSTGIVLFPGVEELDFAGPWEIFSYLAHLRRDACSVFTVSEHGGEVSCAKGLRVLAGCTFENAPAADILIVPGGIGTRREVDNPRTIEFLSRAARDAEVVASVCTGAFLLE